MDGYVTSKLCLELGMVKRSSIVSRQWFSGVSAQNFDDKDRSSLGLMLKLGVLQRWATGRGVSRDGGCQGGSPEMPLRNWVQHEEQDNELCNGARLD